MQGCTHHHIPGVLKDCQRRRALQNALLPLIQAKRLSTAAVSRLYGDFATTTRLRLALRGSRNRPQGAVNIDIEEDMDVDATDSEALDPVRAVNVPELEWTFNGHIIERLHTVFWDDPKSYSSPPPRHPETIPEFKLGNDPKNFSSLAPFLCAAVRSTPTPDCDLPLEFHMLEHDIENLTHPLVEMTRKERREAIDAFLRKHLPVDGDCLGNVFVAAPAKAVLIGRPNLKRRAEDEVETRESKRTRSECAVQ